MRKLRIKNNKLKIKQGFTLIETLVAITVLTVAIAAPLTLASQSLSAAYTARDQVVAFHLAQEAIETVRAQRDHNLLNILKNNPSINWLDGLIVEPPGGNPAPFLVDSITGKFTACTNGESSCPYLKFDKSNGFYGHKNGLESKFKRFVRITEISNTNSDEVRVKVVVSWKSGSFSTRQVVVEENLFNWIKGI